MVMVYDYGVLWVWCWRECDCQSLPSLVCLFVCWVLLAMESSFVELGCDAIVVWGICVTRVAVGELASEFCFLTFSNCALLYCQWWCSSVGVNCNLSSTLITFTGSLKTAFQRALLRNMSSPLTVYVVRRVPERSFSSGVQIFLPSSVVLTS